MVELYANNYHTALASGCDDEETVLIVMAAAPPALRGGRFRILIGSELILVTAGSDSTEWTVERGIEGTTPASHDVGVAVTHVLTAESLLAVGGSIDVRAYGAKGDGVTDDTAAVQAAFDAAGVANAVVRLPEGRFLVGTINFRGQSIIGSGTGKSILLGRPGEDVIHVDPTVSSYDTQYGCMRDFEVVVDDSMDASASFPDRSGVGNAGFAVDFPDGDVVEPNFPLMLLMWDIQNVKFSSLSIAVAGQNKSCGIYNQFQTFNLSRFRNVMFYRLAYGFWDDYPTSNVTASEHARDHIHFDSLYFNSCGRAWRMVNHANSHVTNLVIHSSETAYGLEMIGVSSLVRASNNHVSFDQVMIESSSHAFDISGANTCSFRNMNIAGADAEYVIASHRCFFENFIVHNTPPDAPYLRVTGDRNTIRGLGVSGATGINGRDAVVDEGIGNIIEANWYFSSPYLRRTERVTDGRIGHVRDTISGLMGHVDPMFISGNDLLIDPRSIQPEAPPDEGTDYEFVPDATADLGGYLRVNGSGWYAPSHRGLNGENGAQADWFVPRGKVRVYFKARLSVPGTQLWYMADDAVSIGGVTPSLTTDWSVNYFDADLSGMDPGESFVFLVNSPSNGGDSEVAWIMFRPWAADVLTEGNIEVDNVSGGIILKSPDGTRYIAKIANGGTWSITAA